MMSINSRSVLRPEYLGHSQVHIPNESCYSNILDKRHNTNTAPVYSTDNPCPLKRKPFRRLHPYMRPEYINSPRHSLNGYKNQTVGSTHDHPALRLGASTVPLRNYLSSPDSDAASCPDSCSPNYSYGSRFSSDSINNVKNRKECSPSKKEEYSNTRTYTHGQAEQLRRSRESTTFALIDAQLSRPPLNQVRDMYLQNRSGGTSGNNSSAARTTKKVNLSVVHTVVRFRVKEYLREVQEHVKRLLDALFCNMFEHYDPRMRSSLASQLFGISRMPCSSDCQFCPELLQCARGGQSVVPRCDTRDRQPHTTLSPFHNYARPYSTCSSNTSNTPVLSASDAPSELHDFSPRNSSPEEVDCEPVMNLVERLPSPKPLLSDSLISSNEVPISPRDVLPEEDPILEKPLLTYHMNTDSFTPKFSRARLDSTSLRLVNDFDTVDWSAEHIDFGPCGEEPVDLHTLVTDATTDPLCVKPEESFFDPAYDPIDLIPQFNIDKYPSITLASSP